MNTKKIVALILVVALSFLILAPKPAAAGVPAWAAAVIGGGALLIGVAIGRASANDQHHHHDGTVMYHSTSPVFPSTSLVCPGTWGQEYGWRRHPSGNGMEYVPTGRWSCQH